MRQSQRLGLAILIALSLAFVPAAFAQEEAQDSAGFLVEWIEDVICQIVDLIDDDESDVSNLGPAPDPVG